MTEVVALRPKIYAYLIDGYDDDDYEKNKIINKKAKETKKCVIKQKLMFENYKDCLFNNKTIINIKTINLMIMLMKIKPKIIKIDHILQIIHTEY